MTIKQDKSARRIALSGTILAGAFAAALSPGMAMAQDAVEEEDSIVVTGSRIERQDYISTSPITTVTGEALTSNADVTLETFLNTLPQVNPAGTTSSNNPGNNGQASINLRGLGTNRNLVLVDGRRPMVSSNNLTVDVNTIPAAMIESVEVITGGAGATYGADAIAGAVNIRLRDDFEGADFRAGLSDSTEFWDAQEYNFSAVIGGNFADGRGNAIIGFDRSFREPISKGQRDFSAIATSTTGTPPEGAIQWAGTNPIPQTAIDLLFATPGYGSNPAGAASNTSGRFGFNQNGSIQFHGRAGNPDVVLNWDDPITIDQNPRFFPDFYSYNFDAVNALVLDLDRYSFLADVDYETDWGPTFFAQAGWTEYVASQLLAPTPLPGVTQMNSADANFSSIFNVSNNALIETNTQCLLNPGGSATNCPTSGVAALLVPVSNPFVQANADLMALLGARTGDDPYLQQAGAAEPFRYAVRPLGFGARTSQFRNTVVNFMVGVRGDVGTSGWDYEAYVSEGRTDIILTQFGNVNTQTLQNVLNNPVGTPCATWNPLGNNPLPQTCRAHLEQPVTRLQEFTQQIGQAFIRGDLFDMPAGPVQTVFGAEYRAFEYSDRFATAPGPFSGFNVGPPEGGNNTFFDIFTEALVPLVVDAPFIQSLDLGLGYRRSSFEFDRTLPTAVSSENQDSSAYKVELNWVVTDHVRARASYQRSVRAPNFSELFASSQSFPQIHDPCNVYSAARAGANGAQLAALCTATGVTTIATHASPPGGQAQTTVAGNVNLLPEQGDTYSYGLIVSSPFESDWLSQFSFSIDYYKIEVNDAILAIDPNVAIADCYNYFGNNPSYTLAGNQFCQGLRRPAGTTISRIDNVVVIPNVPANQFAGTNGGYLNSEGIDISAVYGVDLEWLGLPDWGSLDFTFLASRNLAFERQDAPNLPIIDYAGTITFFGQGLGTSFPEWKLTLGTNYSVGDFGFEYRARYTSDMLNRMKVIYVGETNFGQTTPPDVPAVWYHDVAMTWDMTDNAMFRIGVNNVADEQPPEYAPNAQSGTDPSTYDVVGRRAFAQITLRY